MTSHPRFYSDVAYNLSMNVIGPVFKAKFKILLMTAGKC